MHDIIEHYGKVVVALFAIIVILAVAALVLNLVKEKTEQSIGDLDSYAEKASQYYDQYAPTLPADETP